MERCLWKTISFLAHFVMSIFWKTHAAQDVQYVIWSSYTPNLLHTRTVSNYSASSAAHAEIEVVIDVNRLVVPYGLCSRPSKINNSPRFQYMHCHILLFWTLRPTHVCWGFENVIGTLKQMSNFRKMNPLSTLT